MTPRGPHVDPDRLLDESGTLYLCAPAHDQRRLRPLFATRGGPGRSRPRTSGPGARVPTRPPAARRAGRGGQRGARWPSSTYWRRRRPGHGVQLVTVWQDLAQIQARYGTRAGSVVNNHRVKVFLSGIADPGHARARQHAHRRDRAADAVDDRGRLRRQLAHRLPCHAPAGAGRRPASVWRPGHAVVVSGHLPPVRRGFAARGRRTACCACARRAAARATSLSRGGGDGGRSVRSES